MEILTDEKKKEITKISKQFTKGILGNLSINGTGWVVADPLSAYLNFLGYENTLKQIPENGKQPQVLILEFKDGSMFIPAGKDMSNSLKRDVKNFTWIWQPKE